MRTLVIAMSASLVFCLILEALTNKSCIDFLVGTWAGMISMNILKEKII